MPAPAPEPPSESPPPATDEAGAAPTERRLLAVWQSSKRVRTLVAVLLTAAALGALAYIIARQRDAFAAAVVHAVHAPWWLVALGLGLPIVNWWLVAGSFWIMNGRYARTGFVETGALIGSAWLLNYLPLRPGMIGRVTYHKRVHGIPVRSSLRVLLELTLLSALALALILPLALGSAALGIGGWGWWMVACAPIGLLSLLAAGQRASGSGWWRWSASMALRWADIVVWCARYAAMFAIVGAPLRAIEAVVIALVSQAVLLLPIAGNGLGLREAAIGLAAGVMPAAGAWLGEGEAVGGLDAAEARAAIGVAADLVHRGLEVAVGAPVGLICMAWLGRRVARGSADNRAALGPDPVEDAR